MADDTLFEDASLSKPVFAYLVPVLFFFGFGPVAAMIATIVYALPPMVRVTMLALDGVEVEDVRTDRDGLALQGVELCGQLGAAGK